MVVGTYRHFAISNEHDNHNRTTPTRKWKQVRWTPTGFQPTDHDDYDDDVTKTVLIV